MKRLSWEKKFDFFFHCSAINVRNILIKVFLELALLFDHCKIYQETLPLKLTSRYFVPLFPFTSNEFKLEFGV